MKSGKEKLAVGIVGATGMVGQRFITLLENHPWFEVKVLSASIRSAGKTYKEAVKGRWAMENDIPKAISGMIVRDSEDGIKKLAGKISFVFSAIDADKTYIRELEERYAAAGIPVVSNNSAHRWTKDVPMLMPEINPAHLDMIAVQQKNRGWSKAFIICKPNCSIQSYVPMLKAWEKFGPQNVLVSTYQAISGAGKTFDTWPEMVDNVIPNIGGEEEKSEKEPLKILGKIQQEAFVSNKSFKISANCLRVPVLDGHMATINISFEKTPSKQELIAALKDFENPLADMGLPSAPGQFITYYDDPARPQTKTDRDLYGGMGISAGRLREDNILDWKLVGLSHNTLRGAAGGSVLNAELLYKKGYFN